MAVKAGKALHAEAMDHPVCMTFRTCLLVWRELVQIAEMAFCAADLLHKYVSCMAVRTTEALRTL